MLYKNHLKTFILPKKKIKKNSKMLKKKINIFTD